MATQGGATSSDAAILSRLIGPERDDLSSEAAQALLRLHFQGGDLDRLHELTVKNQGDALTPAERSERESYLRIIAFLDLVRAKARRSLKKHA